LRHDASFAAGVLRRGCDTAVKSASSRWAFCRCCAALTELSVGREQERSASKPTLKIYRKEIVFRSGRANPRRIALGDCGVGIPRWKRACR
jgi:hypothetical protein